MKFIQLIITLAICAAIPAHAVQRNLEITWEHVAETGVTPDGYRLYAMDQETPLCSIEHPQTNTMTCQADLDENMVIFTMTSYLKNGNESPHSAPFTYTFPTTQPKASLDCNPISGQAPLLVSCNGSESSGEISSYSWTFGDSNDGSGQQVEHLYKNAGNYQATLTVTSSTGEQDSKFITITVTNPPENHPPIARIDADQTTGDSPLRVNFNASTSTDQDGDLLSYNWDFGDNTNSQGITVTHLYATPGIYTVRLQVTDIHNASSSATIPIIVKESAEDPKLLVAIISIKHPRVILQETPFLISGERSKPSTTEERIISYQWTLGDGTTKYDRQFIHQYDTPGEYTITLKVNDSSEKTATTQKIIRVITHDQLLQILSIQQRIYQLLLNKENKN